MNLFDSHCHLDAAEFDADRAQVLASARAAGVAAQLIPAVDRASWPAIATLVAREPGLYAAYGLHPMFLDRHTDADLAALPAFIAAHPTVAVGECGLDFFLPDADRDRQRAILRPQLELARERDLPVILHGRRALDALLAEVRSVGGLRGIVHSFSGSQEQARQWCQAGFLLGFGGPVSYPRASRLRAVVADLPLAHLALETDAPDQPLFGHQGQRNTPAHLPQVLAVIAELRQQDPATIATATTHNLRQLL
ncbi:MAG: TatD family hydrolase, partial [Lysobacterales bacterium]